MKKKPSSLNLVRIYQAVTLCVDFTSLKEVEKLQESEEGNLLPLFLVPLPFLFLMHKLKVFLSPKPCSVAVMSSEDAAALVPHCATPGRGWQCHYEGWNSWDHSVFYCFSTAFPRIGDTSLLAVDFKTTPLCAFH